jgi:REP element-mobilizing transposase RayT
MNRGVEGSTLFATPGHAATFVTTLGDVAAQQPIEIHAYCAMGNHYHLLARAQEHDLRDALVELEAVIPVKTARARLLPMRFGRHLLHVTRYIHRNPVDAGWVERPVDWPWSSYRAYLDRLQAPAWLRTRAVLGCLGSIGAREAYSRYVEGRGPGEE